MKFSTTIISLLLCTSFFCHGIIIESYSIQDFLNYSDQETLAIFDIDNTLTELQSSLEIGGHHWFNYLVQEKENAGLSHIDATESILPIHLAIHLQSLLKPVEKYTPSLIHELQQKKIKTIALTARPLILVDRTVEQLLHIDIDFSITPLYRDILMFNAEYPACHKNGIVFTGYNSKGQTLIAFLDLINYNPKKIVFIDDKLEYIKSVEKAVEERNIEFIGIHYKRLEEKEKNFDPAKAQQELSYFLATGTLPVIA